MSTDFLQLTGARFVSGETKPSGKFVLATSEVASIERGQDNTSVIVLHGGERFNVIELYGDLRRALTGRSARPSPT